MPSLRSAARLLALLACAGFGPAVAAQGPAAAQEAPAADWSRPLESIRSVRHPTDEEGAPVRLGETVLVAGRVTAGTGAVRADAVEVYLQDGTGGLRLRLPPTAAPVGTGDSVLVHGVVGFRDGMVEMVHPHVRGVNAPPRRVSPRALPLRPRARGGRGPDLEGHEGELVEVEGRVVQADSTESGRLLVLLSGTDLVQVFAYRLRASPVRFGGVRPGDYVRVRGVAAQHDPLPPYTGSYLVLAVDDAPVRRAGLSPTEYKYGALAVGALLLGALLWGGTLRAEVRRRAAALQLSEARYGALFDAAADPVFVLDLEHDGTVVEANGAAQRAFGVLASGRRADGTAVRLADVAQDAEEANLHLADALRGGTATAVLELLRPDGDPVPFEVATRRLHEGGAPLVVSIARDVEERRLYEHGLLEAIQGAEAAREAAEEAAQLKAAILANMSHEIRTPLTAILGFADLLGEEVPPDLSEFVGAIQSGGRRLLETLNDVLEYARLDAEGATLQAAPADAVEVVRSAVALLAPLAKRKGIGLSLQASARSLPAMLPAPAFGRVVTNLVGNAVKFTERGGVTVTLHASPDGLVLRVRDTGVGISEAFLPSLFEAFRQESDGHSRTFEGTGLGLSITQRLVEGMGGSIRVESEKGVGTLFEVAVPAPVPADPSMTAPAPTTPPPLVRRTSGAAV